MQAEAALRDLCRKCEVSDVQLRLPKISGAA